MLYASILIVGNFLQLTYMVFLFSPARELSLPDTNFFLTLAIIFITLFQLHLNAVLAVCYLIDGDFLFFTFLFSKTSVNFGFSSHRVFSSFFACLVYIWWWLLCIFGILNFCLIWLKFPFYFSSFELLPNLFTQVILISHIISAVFLNQFL